jgi:hypothetical protein
MGMRRQRNQCPEAGSRCKATWGIRLLAIKTRLRPCRKQMGRNRTQKVCELSGWVLTSVKRLSYGRDA